MTYPDTLPIRWNIGLLICLTVVIGTDANCPPSWPTVSEECLASNTPAAEPNSLLTSYENLLHACSHYNATIECMNKHIESCLQFGGDVTGGISIREKMQSDLDNICGSNDTFIKFQKYYACFAQVAEDSAKCQESIPPERGYEYRYFEYYGYEEADDNICEEIKRLLDCINDIVQVKCGADAVELYDHMILSQLPSHVTDTCPGIASNSWRVTSLTPLVGISLLIACLL